MKLLSKGRSSATSQTEKERKKRRAGRCRFAESTPSYVANRLPPLGGYRHLHHLTIVLSLPRWQPYVNSSISMNIPNDILHCRSTVFCAALFVFASSAFASVADEITEIRDATIAFLGSLNEDQKANCNLAFDHSDREDWKYVPANRLGLGMREMNDAQREELDAVRQAIHSADGLEKSKGVILCETFLYDMSGHDDFRDPGKYHLTVYGTPDEKEPWGLRFEGHHISLNYTFVGNQAVAAAPAFYGANPATITEGSNKGLRILKDEEDLARDLIHSLNADQKGVAVFRSAAFEEIVTHSQPKVSPLEPVGLAYSDMKAAQQKKIMSVISEYLSWMPDAIAAERLERVIEGGLDHIRFGWAGGIEKGDLHYYRIQGPSFLIEYDNFQGKGTHIHSVWRDFKGDFGRDLLKEHYEHGHAH